MSSGAYNVENEIIDKQIYTTFKIVLADSYIGSVGGRPLHLLITDDKPIIKQKVSPKEFFYYMKDEVDQYDKTGQFVDRKKALEIWNLMEGYYPPKDYNTAAYFNDLKLKKNKKNTGDENKNNSDPKGRKYKQAFY